MSLSQLIVGWFYYGIFFMGLSVVATLVLNRVVKRYITAPLIINAFSILLLLGLMLFKQMTNEQFWFNLFFRYMPVVAASAIFNMGQYVIRKGAPLQDEVYIEMDLEQDNYNDEGETA